MDHAAFVLDSAHQIYARNDTSSDDSSTTTTRPAIYKTIGICLAVSSGAFIGTSFVFKKYGLLRANEKYNEVAGDGYGYLKNAYWWLGMTLMIIGEACNFVAYAFTDAILVTPLGALSVVIATVLSAYFLKERLSMVGKVACFLCIVGTVVIVLNAPDQSSVSTIQEMQHYVISPGFLSYAGVIIVGSIATAYWAGPRWGKKNMLVYISICSWIGGLSVVSTEGIGSAILAQIGGTMQVNQWFFWVLLVFVISTLVTEIIFLNKALNLFNAALVTPTYYVYFTTTTIITEAILFRGFHGTVTAIITVVNGFLTICAGVVLLQLSKSAKDVPDATVFTGDLDQIQTIAEQEQSETEPKADAIRGAAALVRRISAVRQNREVAELKRLHEESKLEPVGEDGASLETKYEWDGIRRRRTLYNSQRSRATTATSDSFTLPPRTPHPPLGWSHMPTEEELEAIDRANTPSVLSSIAGTIRMGRRPTTLLPSNTRTEPIRSGFVAGRPTGMGKIQSPMHPVQLTDIAVPTQNIIEDDSSDQYYGFDGNRYDLPSVKTEYHGASGSYASSDAASVAPEPPPHSARRQFSFQNMFRRHQPSNSFSEVMETGKANHSAETVHHHRPVISRGYAAPRVNDSTEEERLGLVKNDPSHAPAPRQNGQGFPSFVEDDDDEDDRAYSGAEGMHVRYGRGIAGSPPRFMSEGGERTGSRSHESRGSHGNIDGNGHTDLRASPPATSRRYNPPQGGDDTFI